MRHAGQWVSTGEAAKLIGRSDETVRRLVRSGLLDSSPWVCRYWDDRPRRTTRKLMRISVASLLDYLSLQAVKGTGRGQKRVKV